MEKLLKKDATFYWHEECQWNLILLKEKMVTASILVFPNVKKEFHVDVDVSCIMLGVVLTQAGEGESGNLISFVSSKMSKAENNYSMIKHE